MRVPISVRVLLSIVFLGAGFTMAQQSADVILYNGKVVTVNKNFAIAEALAVRGDRIAAVGNNADVLKLAGPQTVRIDLRGKTVTPGLINTHVHVHGQAEGGYGGELGAVKMHEYPLNWRLIRTKDDALKQIAKTMNAFKFKPGEWVFFSAENRGGEGPNAALAATGAQQVQVMWKDLNRWEIDKVTPDNPVVLSLSVPLGAASLANSKAIEILWKDYGPFIEKYGRYRIDSSGRPEGHLEPIVSRLVFEYMLYPPVEELGPLYRKTLEEVLSRGITTISTRLPDYAFKTYQWLDSQGEMPVRIGWGSESEFGHPTKSIAGLKLGSGSDMLWLNSVTSRGVDGSGARMCTDLPRNREAAKEQAQASQGVGGMGPLDELFPRGQCYLDIEYKGGGTSAPIKANYFREWILDVAKNNLRIANIHVAGDATFTKMLSTFEEINAAKPGIIKGWGMDHCNLINPTDVSRIAKLGVMISCSTGELEDIAEVFGDKAANTYRSPFKSMLNLGINVSVEGEGQGSLWGAVEWIVTRKDSKGKVWGAPERLDRATALRIATQHGANYLLRGDKLGSLEVGKLADLVVLDRDYMAIPEEDISEIHALVAMVGGKIKFVNKQFSEQTGLRPAGALISSYDELVKRRKRFGSSRS